MTIEVDTAADELYGLPAGEFISSRDRMATDARRAGDRETAAAIKAFRRPTASAWTVNQLVRRAPDLVGELLHVAGALALAQAGLAADDLRRLTQEGQGIVSELSQQARTLAEDAGQPLSEAGLREVEETLHAALADSDAGDSVRAGRLTTALRYSGFGLAGVAPGAPAAAVPVPTADRPAAAASGDGQPSSPDAQPSAAKVPAPGRRDREHAAAAEEELRAAQAEVQSARRELTGLERGAALAEKQLELIRQRIRQLTEQLEQQGAEEVEAGATAEEARRSAEDAQRRYRDAEARLGRAQEESGQPQRRR